LRAGEFAAFLIVKFLLGGVPPPAPEREGAEIFMIIGKMDSYDLIYRDPRD
jgi:hypothetical protein